MKNRSPKPARPAPALSPATIAISVKLQRAIAAHQQGDLQQAGLLYLEILEVEPNNFDALHLLGVYALQSGDAQAACDLIGRAVEVDPNEALAFSNLGVARQRMRRFDDALRAYQSALRINPEHQAALSNCGSTLQEMQRHGEAIAFFERALRVKPDYAEALSNLGNSLIALKRPEEALIVLDRALELNQAYVAALFNRANALQYLNRPDEAILSYRRALLIDPGHVDANFNDGVCRLLNGDFENGFRQYEWRWRKEAYLPLKQEFGAHLWLGAPDLQGKTILVYSEQGLGDTIQFCRYVKLLAGLGAKVIVRVQPALKSLLSGLPGAQQVLGTGEALPAFDFHCPLMSLPLAFQTRLDTVPAEPSYLAADPARVAAWQAKLGPKTLPRIGLAWAGSAGHDNDAARSIPLLTLMRLVGENAQYVSIQKDLGALDRLLLARQSALLHFAEAQTDFAETAALIANLDLVVTVDTSVAHLAAAMGKPVWILLPWAPDWRWMLERADSPWYPSATLVRQPKAGDWDSVLARVAAQIAQL
ncbi:MAG: glycosyltransferase family protein [Burkholderiaceae bacterium]|nr:glycosyltransferase family protein [Burkholderiaceae bacterium]